MSSLIEIDADAKTFVGPIERGLGAERDRAEPAVGIDPKRVGDHGDHMGCTPDLERGAGT